jgi:beta-glucanase (GH16 family)
MQAWHTAVIERTPDRVTYWLDGQRVGTSTNRVPTGPMHWVLQTETAIGGAAPPPTAAGNIQIDWVAAWR